MKKDRLEQMAARLAGIIGELEPYADTPDAGELQESLQEDPLNTIEFLLDALDGLMA